MEIHQIPRTEIQIPDRQRKVYPPEKVNELLSSIVDRGLLHPLIVRRALGNEDDSSLYLLTGGCRLLALDENAAAESPEPIRCAQETVKLGFIPCLLYEDLNAVEAQEIELDENIQRTELTWRERSLAIAKLHRLRQLQIKTAPEADTSWTLGDTADEVGQKTGVTPTSTQVSDDLLIADNLDKITGAPNRKEALKQIHKNLENVFAAELGRRQTSRAHSTEAIQGIKFKSIDALAGMQELADESVNLVLTDPPYGVGAQDYFGEASNSHQYKDDWKTISGLLRTTFKEAFRVTKRRAHIYMFCDLVNFLELKRLATVAGWVVWPRPLIWAKDTGHIPMPNYGPRRQYETILFANKNSHPTTHLASDVLTYPNPKGKEHAAQKPVDLYIDLIRRSTIPGGIVLDPFCGSGTIFIAAAKANCTAVGFDDDPTMVELIKRRIAQEKPTGITI